MVYLKGFQKDLLRIKGKQKVERDFLEVICGIIVPAVNVGSVLLAGDHLGSITPLVNRQGGHSWGTSHSTQPLKVFLDILTFSNSQALPD